MTGRLAPGKYCVLATPGSPARVSPMEAVSRWPKEPPRQHLDRLGEILRRSRHQRSRHAELIQLHNRLRLDGGQNQHTPCHQAKRELKSSFLIHQNKQFAEYIIESRPFSKNSHANPMDPLAPIFSSPCPRASLVIQCRLQVARIFLGRSAT